MGITMTPRSVKLGERAERQICEIQDFFSPFCSNRSATLRVVIDLMHVIITTPGILEKVSVALQGIQCANFVIRTQQRVLSPEKPGPVRMETEAKPRRSSVNSTYRLMAKAGSVGLCRHKDRTSFRTSFAGVMGRVA